MTTFRSRTMSRADVPAPRSAIWSLLTDPDALADMTPLLDTISVDGDLWCWQLRRIEGLGMKIAPSFTEQMTFDAPSRIEYRHAPPAGSSERAGAAGVYNLTELEPKLTRLEIDITIHVELPLPRLSRTPVERIMRASMDRTGAVFGERLYTRLGLDPTRAASDTVLVES